MKLVIVMVTLASWLYVSIQCSSDTMMWNTFKHKHRKSYKNKTQESEAFARFRANKDYIDKFNAQPGKGYKLAVNEFSDWI